MIFKEYSIFLKEHAFFDNDYDRYDNYLSDIKDIKKTLKNVDFEIKLLVELLTNINFNEIKFSNYKYKDNINYEIKFSKKINFLITPLIELLSEIEIENKDSYIKICNVYFNDQNPNLSFDIQLDRNNFNKFHFPIDLPSFLKNIGLGKKIIRSAVEKFDYLLFMKEEDSLELKLTVDSITKMSDVFSFMIDHNILIIKDDFNLVKTTLVKWFHLSNENFTLDKDFLNKYKEFIIKDDFLSIIYKNKL